MGSGSRPVADAMGTLADVPIAHALLYLRTKQVSGVLDLRAPGSSNAWVAFSRGRVRTISTTPTVARFATVCYETGIIDAATLEATTKRAASDGRPQQEILVEEGFVTPDEALAVTAEQTRMRVAQLFRLPPTTTFTFRESRPTAAEHDVDVDVLAPVWRGLVESPPRWRVSDLVAALGDRALRVVDVAIAEAAELDRAEAELVERLARGPRTLAELHDATDLPPARVDLLVYFLVLARAAAPSEGPTVLASGEMWAVTAPGDLPRSSPPPEVHESSARVTSGPLSIDAIRARAANVDDESPYERLGLPTGASVEAVRAAYFRLGRVWNPSKLPPHLEDARDDVEHVWARMTDAHRALTDAHLERSRQASGHGRPPK